MMITLFYVPKKNREDREENRKVYTIFLWGNLKERDDCKDFTRENNIKMNLKGVECCRLDPPCSG